MSTGSKIVEGMNETTRRLNLHLFGGPAVNPGLALGREIVTVAPVICASSRNAEGNFGALLGGPVKKRIRQDSKPLMNNTEQRCRQLLASRGVVGIMQQAITLRLDPPFKSYRPDLAYLGACGLVFVEAKGQHRFRRAGIAKAALAAKTYPQFRFELFEWDGKAWKESVLSS